MKVQDEQAKLNRELWHEVAWDADRVRPSGFERHSKMQPQFLLHLESQPRARHLDLRPGLVAGASHAADASS